MNAKGISICLGFLLALSFFSANAFAVNVCQDTVGCWQLNETSGTTAEDDSGNGFNGTLTGSQNWVAGVFNNSFYFNNSPYFTSSTSTILNPGNMSISFWIRINGTQATFVLQKRLGCACDGYFVDIESAGTIHLFLDKRGTGTGFVEVRSTAGLTSGTWYLITFTYDNSNARLYINGTFNASGSSTQGNLGTNADNLYFGAGRVGGSPMNATLDELKIFSRNLTDTEVSNLYTCNSVSSCSTASLNYSGNTSTPSSPQIYPITQTHFNISWSSSLGLSKAWITHNFTGTSTNFTMLNDTPTHFYFYLNDSAAGTFVYQFFANDTSNNLNNTPQNTYIINQNQSAQLNLSINGTQADVSGTYPYPTNTTGWKNISAGTITLYRNGTSVNSSSTLNSTSEIIQLGAGTYNYTIALNHQNYTATPVTRILIINQANSGITLTSSAGWNIQQNTQTTVTCSANSPLTTSLTRNSIGVPNPYTATLSFGSYTFTCTIGDSQNYTPSTTTQVLNVLSAGTGCTNSSLYIYTVNIPISASQVTLNFTGLVNQSIVRTDLGDINVTTPNVSVNKFINTTQSFILVNSSNVSSFIVNFGNYFFNTSYTNTSLTNQTVTNFNYSQNASFYYTVNLLNEINGSSLYPLPNTTSSAAVSISISCTNGANSFNVTQATFNFPASQQLNSSRITITYSPTAVYYRDLMVTSPIQFLNFYIIDAIQYQVVQMLMQLQDNTGSFLNSNLQVTKILGGQAITITQLPFDVEHKAIVYLQNGGVYQVYVNSNSQTRAIGNLFVDNVNLVKTIVISPIAPTTVQQGNVSYSFNFNNQTGVMVFTWIDPLGNTKQLNFTVYNQTDGTQIAFFTTTNSSNIVFTYTVPNVNQTYRFVVSVSNTVIDALPIVITRIFGGLLTAFPILTIPQFAPDVMYIASFLTLITLPMFFDARNGALAGVIVAAAAAMLTYVGWWGVGVAVVGIAFALAVMNKLSERRRVDE